MKNQLVTYHRPASLDGVELLHCADRDFSLAPHVHDSYVFWFNGLGGDRVTVGGVSDILQPDSFGIVAPGEVHANHAVTDRRTLHSMYVDAAIVDDVARQRGERVAEFRSRLYRDPEARRKLVQLHALLMHVDDPFAVREAFIESIGLLLERHGEYGGFVAVCRDPVKVRQVKTIMSERFGEPLDLDGVAAEAGCSVCHLIRLFRRETGMTPHAYLMECRLNHARSRLSGKNAITDIALESGFTDQSHLTRRFHARFGLTPGRYRTQIA